MGSGTFTKAETGRADTFELKPDEAGQRYLRDRLKAGGTIWIVMAPDDEDVAATYFGAGGEPEGNRPGLSIDGESEKCPEADRGFPAGCQTSQSPGWCNPGCNQNSDLS